MSSSQESSSASFNIVAQPYLDSSLGKLFLQSLLTGVYLNIFVQTMIPIIHQKRRKMYTLNLIVLFGAVSVSLAASWTTIKDAFILEDATQGIIASSALDGQLTAAARIIGSSSSLIAVFAGDIILVSRCFIVCARSKAVLSLFSFLLIGQCAIIIAETVPSVKPNNRFPLTIPTYYFVSLAITVLATSIIILRITYVSRKSGVATSRYSYTMEVLFESGGLYAASLLITSILMIVSTNHITISNGPVTQAKVYWEGVMTPMAGIAPTLIAFRVATGRARDESSWSQPQSTLQFRRTPGNITHSDNTATPNTI
ncbi:hypothetical protein D9619_003874 [Psilocybe cf. subviscida]|uniref:Uncharacterized protein n=1 Tax=Psilocybe cf. subviscida TaxID=2480587 RepID=A0A8H5BRC4_9AGAR|nr:hypothetical protein D9619_003874 [Psilocybe cf. subviscida]